MHASVLIPYFCGRRLHLERTLWLLSNQTYKDYDVWILDDGADDCIDELIDQYNLEFGDRLIYERVRDPGAHPRASNMAWNHGYTKCGGDFVILGHPEYLVPLNAIELLVNSYKSNRVGPHAFALSFSMTRDLDLMPWRENLDSLQDFPNFWDFVTPWNWKNIDGFSWCHHFAFTGQPRSDWDRYDFMPKTEFRGQNDSWLHPIEIRDGRPAQFAGFNVYHQHHDRLGLRWWCTENKLRAAGVLEEKHGVDGMSVRVRRIYESSLG